MKLSIRVAMFALAALAAAACSSTADTADADAPVETADEPVETVDAEVDTGEATEDEAETETDTAEEPVVEASTTTAPSPPPEPVTATTVHETTSDDFPDILAAQATPTGDNSWRFDVTVSSTYDSPQRYADAWRVVGPDGTEYGIRVLTHDHAGEQPFTRSQSGIEIPADVTTVTIEGRDLANGWGGGFLQLDLS